MAAFYQIPRAKLCAPIQQAQPPGNHRIEFAFATAKGGGAISEPLSLAEALGMDVTAEVIETPRRVTTAAALHCSRGQGYSFARPLPPRAVTELLVDGGRVQQRAG